MPKQKTKTPYVAEFEELVILAILKIGADAYGASIYEALEEAGRSTAIGALYTTLSRMEAKGLITSRAGESTPERGGRPRKYFEVTAGALRAIEERSHVRKQLQPNLAWSFGGGS